MWPHILSSKFLNNFDIRDIQQELTVGLYCAAVGWRTRLFQWTSSGILILKNTLTQNISTKIWLLLTRHTFHRTVETFFRDTYAPWKSNTNGMALISNPLPAPRSRMGGAIILPSFFACFGMLQGDLYLYRKWNTLCFTQHFFLAHCPDLYERTHITGLESHFSEHERMMQDTSELPSVTEFLFLHARYDDLTWAVFRKWDNGRCNNKSMWNTLFLCTEIY